MGRFSQIIETPQGRLSSKRICGIIGWIAIIIGFLFILFSTGEAPSFTEFLICATVALLGVDSVTGAFNKRHKHGENKGQTGEEGI